MANSRALQWTYHALMGIYLAGYSIYLFVAGWDSWPRMTFWDWSVHISYESIYALAWPVFVLLSLLGYR
jgi:hypothetical protein